MRRRPPPPNEPADSYEDDVEKLNKEIMQTRHHAGNSNDSVALRRQAFTTNGTGSTAGGDAKLQFRVNELSRQLEDLKYEKLHLTTKVKDLEKSLMTKSSKMVEEELRKKLLAAEQLCEELMDENSEIKREMRGMEDEMDEIADNFREDQANEYTTIKKELEIAVKNCRILSFKLKKSERRIEQIEQEKQASTPAALTSQIKQLEEELKLANNRLQQLEIEAEKTQHNGGGGGGRPMLNMIGKSNSVDGKYSRASLTRGGSQEDPSQLMRDLQDSVEREADVREQLKYAEEEADSLRKKIARMEDENESLMVQLRKMATKSRSKPSKRPPPRVAFFCVVFNLQILFECRRSQAVANVVVSANGRLVHHRQRRGHLRRRGPHRAAGAARPERAGSEPAAAQAGRTGAGKRSHEDTD